MSDEAPVGFFEEQVMVAVLRTGDEAFGMNVRREIEEVTGREIAIGAVYATLDRLEAKRLIASRRVGASGSSRRIFAVTAHGVAALLATREMRDRLWHGIPLSRLAAQRAR